LEHLILQNPTAYSYAKSLHSSILDHTGEGVIIVNEKNKIIEINKSCENITGYSFTEVVNKCPRVFSSGMSNEVNYVNIWKQIIENGFWIGELLNRHKNGNIYPIIIKIHKFYNDETKQLNYFGIFTTLSSQEEINSNLLHLAYHDPLTNLPNRLKLEAQLEYVVNNSKRNNLQFAILFLDLDDFKIINDTLGHASGDEVLISFANKFKDIIRTNDMIARVGGDEFIVVLSDISNYLFIERVCNKILTLVNKPFNINNTSFNIGVSIGIAIYPDNGLEIKTLISNADSAMYHAKNKGKNNFDFFSNKMTEKLDYQAKRELELFNAIKNDEFIIHFQPEIDLQTNKVFALEVLARWDNGNNELIMPSDFILDLDKANHIIEFEKLILIKSCFQLKNWHNNGKYDGIISVNISGKHLEHGNLYDSITHALKITKLNPKYLELEFRESDVMKISTKTLFTLNNLSLLGVGLSIDNFGKGFSSFNYLRECSISKLKIDKSYIQSLLEDKSDENIVKSIIDLGINMGLSVIAEGIEFPLQDEIVKKNSCSKVQGYFYAKPMPAIDFEDWHESFQQINIKA
jgi:diguanylate cyclase (GGDEF)-like protein/PAS domain S-box-containing protein